VPANLIETIVNKVGSKFSGEPNKRKSSNIFSVYNQSIKFMYYFNLKI